MARILLIFIIAFAVITAGNATNSNPDGNNETIPIVDFNEIRPLLNKNNDTTYVINFWATWCSPCVKEIPHFEEINEKYSNQRLKVLLISLDFPTQYETRLIPFIKNRNILSEVILLDDPDSNSWINEVSTEWSGAIPATVIYNKSKRQFYEKVFTMEELEEEVKKFLNQ